MHLDAAHMTSLFENATEGIVLVNQQGEIVLANPSAGRMFGYDPDELIGQQIEILIPERFSTYHHHHRDGFYEKPSNRVMGQGRDLYGKKKDGTDLPVEVSLSHYKKENQLFVIAFVVDITKRKEIESSMLQQKRELEKITDKIRQLNASLEVKVEERTLILKEALQKLEQSQLELSEALDKERQLNEIKSRFVSMASHEFRTPLSTVLSSASLLSKYKSGDEQEKRDKHIQRIKNSVNHLNDILEDFLSLGKLNEGKVDKAAEQVCLKDVILDTMDEMRGILKKEQYFDFQCTSDCNACTDKKLFKNILINLISNASKFSEEGKKILIQSQVIADNVVVSVTDEGIGISDEDQQHLFSSFFRGANATNIQGTGLGLHIVKSYIDLLAGEVKLKSTLNRGTTITFTIPVNLPDAE
jgi:PAS domain S-box-containing protein